MTNRERRKLHKDLTRLESYHFGEHARAPEVWAEGHRFIDLLPEWSVCPNLGYGGQKTTSFSWLRVDHGRTRSFRCLTVNRSGTGSMVYLKATEGSEDRGDVADQVGLETLLLWMGEARVGLLRRVFRLFELTC